MKNKLIFGLVLFLIFGVIAGSIWGVTNRTSEASNYKKLSAEERVLQSKKDIEEMRKNPDRESHVLVSFDNLLNKEFIKELEVINNLHVLQIYHAYIADKKYI